MEYFNIFLGFILIIIVYCFYLNIIKKHTKIEGFADTNNTIKKLIESKDNSFFSVKVWDNYNVLSNKYSAIQKSVPLNKQECLGLIKSQQVNNINETTASNFKLENALSNIICPVSIWRSTPNEGYDSIGDVITTSYKSPALETVTDMSKPIISNNQNLINLKTKVVLGVNAVEPEDFVYIGSFGSDKMPDKLLLNEATNQSLKKIAFYLNIFKTAINQKKNTFINNINNINKTIQDSFGYYVDQLNKITSNQIEPITFNSILLLRNMINDNKFTINSNVMSLQNTVISSNKNDRNRKLQFGINQKINKVIHNYTISSAISKMPYDVITHVFKDYNYSDEQNLFNYTLYDYSMTNMNILTPTQLSGNFGNTVTFSYNPNNNHPANYVDNHSKITSPANVKISLNTLQDVIYKKGTAQSITTFFTSGSTSNYDHKDTTRNTIIGKLNTTDETMLTFHPSFDNDSDFQDKQIISFQISVLSDYISLLENDINNDAALKAKYDDLINAINNYYVINPTSVSKTDYYKLSIWQPIPPSGYVALGYVFTNENEDVKPSKSMIKCVPDTCVKSFKRRKWSKDDIIYLHSDTTQKFAFYRNPYLGTCIVVDLNKTANSSSNDIPTPSFIKYRNEKDSLTWDCFDIIPCVKECDYVKRLEDADTNARKTCSAYRSLENQYFDKTEVKKSIQDEESKYNSLLKEKKTYITSLMDSVNKLMSEDELYKIITQGLNRYKTKKDLEEQHELHGKVADKLLETRGLEISWDNPTEMTKFKDLLKRLTVAQVQKVKKVNKRDCPVCKLPDTKDMVNFKELELCYGCMEDLVRELIGKKTKANEPIPQELLNLEASINANANSTATPTPNTNTRL